MKQASSKKTELLTARQQQLVELVARGFSNKEIAHELAISEGTVKQHIYAIFRILNVVSRAKLALIGQRMAPRSEGERASMLLNASKGTQYSWRLISAVAIYIPQITSTDPKVIVQRNQQLLDLRANSERMAHALDGKTMPLPDGGELVWFGHPVTHIDDPQRASRLAQSVWQQIAAQPALGKGLGLGISTVAEVVPGNSAQLISALAFQSALSLAKKSSALGLTLANALTQRLCPASAPWIALRPTPEKTDAANSKVREAIFAISADLGKQEQGPHTWGALPFLAEAFQTAKNGVAQWVSVESWPPTLANNLIDAIGMDAALSGFKPLRLHLPSAKRADAILQSLLTQTEMILGGVDIPLQKNDTDLDRLLSLLQMTSSQMPLVIQVYGIQSLAAFKTAIGSRGIDRLVSMRVLVVVANLRDSQKPKTSIRMLGARPDNLLFTRVHTMDEPKLDLLPEGVMVDMQAMVDDLSAPARQVIFAAADQPGCATEELLSKISIPRPVMQVALQELTNAGLIMPRDKNHFDFRDALTISAITQLKKIAIAA